MYVGSNFFLCVSYSWFPVPLTSGDRFSRFLHALEPQLCLPWTKYLLYCRGFWGVSNPLNSVWVAGGFSFGTSPIQVSLNVHLTLPCSWELQNQTKKPWTIIADKIPFCTFILPELIKKPLNLTCVLPANVFLVKYHPLLARLRIARFVLILCTGLFAITCEVQKQSKSNATKVTLGLVGILHIHGTHCSPTVISDCIYFGSCRSIGYKLRDRFSKVPWASWTWPVLTWPHKLSIYSCLSPIVVSSLYFWVRTGPTFCAL